MNEVETRRRARARVAYQSARVRNAIAIVGSSRVQQLIASHRPFRRTCRHNAQQATGSERAAWTTLAEAPVHRVSAIAGAKGRRPC
jgi:hypothetical protein